MSRLHWGLALLLLAATLPAQAGRGRHGVEDAELLEPGECVLESAVTRLDGGDMRYLVEPACRVGPVQLSAEVEHTRLRPDGSATERGLEVKWARPLREDLHVGLMWRPAWELHEHPRFQGHMLVALATWKPREDLAIHFNAGRDFGWRDKPGEKRGGVAAEWAFRPNWITMLERYREQDTQFLRLAVRWAPSRKWMIDLGRAQRLAGPVASQWGVGVSIELSRD